MTPARDREAGHGGVDDVATVGSRHASHPPLPAPNVRRDLSNYPLNAHLTRGSSGESRQITSSILSIRSTIEARSSPCV